MSDIFDVYTYDNHPRIALANTDVSTAEEIDLNLQALSETIRVRTEALDTRRASVRKNPHARAFSEISEDIRKILGEVPESLKAAKAHLKTLGLDRRELSNVVAQLIDLYNRRDAIMTPLFASSVAKSMSRDISKNAGFLIDDGILELTISAQSSIFREAIARNPQSSFADLSEDEQSILTDMLLMMEVFVDIGEGTSSFTDAAFFTSLGSLSKRQLRAFMAAANASNISKPLGSHYAPPFMAVVQALSVANPKVFIKGMADIEAAKRSFPTAIEMLEQVSDFDGMISQGTIADIVASAQNYGVAVNALQLAAYITFGTKAREGAYGTVGVENFVRATKVLDDGSPFPRSAVSQMFLVQFGIVSSILTSPKIADIDQFMSSMFRESPVDAIRLLKGYVSVPKSVDADYLFAAYVTLEVFEAEISQRQLHYFEWAMDLAELLNRKVPYAVPEGRESQTDESDIYSELMKSSGNLEKAIDIITIWRENKVRPEILWNDESFRDLPEQRNNGARPLSSKLTDVALSVLPSDLRSVAKKFFNGRNYESAIVHYLNGALLIEDPYDLMPLAFDLVDVSGEFPECVVAITRPLNPLEIYNGYRNLGYCCMKPFNYGPIASTAAFYGNNANSVYTFRHNTPTSETSRRFVSLGTMFLPQFNVGSPPPPAPRGVSITAEPTALQLNMSTGESLRTAISADGWEKSYQAETVDATKPYAEEGVRAAIAGVFASHLGGKLGLTLARTLAYTEVLKDMVDSNVFSGDLQLTKVDKKGYVDGPSPTALTTLSGRSSNFNPDIRFKSLHVTFASEGSEANVMYEGLDGTEYDVGRVAWDWVRYMFSFPKGPNFMLKKGSIHFHTGASNKGVCKELMTPAWFDGPPLIRGDRKLTKTDLVNMRTPEGGAFIHTDSGKTIKLL
jgi:hypothetical protein